MVQLLDGRLELDRDLYELRRDGAVVPIEPQAFDVLVHLVDHRDRVVPKEELMDVVWGGRFVAETAVTSRIKQVRRALGDDGRSQRLVRTVHGRGYRFVAGVRASEPSTEPSAPSGATPAAPPTGGLSPVRYTVSDGLHIAYQVTGGGERDVVLISGFVSHLDLDWEDPRHVYFLDRLGSMGRLIRFDKRGTGMSDRPSGVPDLETRMHDVLAVMDAAESERAVLFGYSEGGPMAVLMAAMHPERVSALVLYGAYARRIWAEDYPWGQTQERRKAYTEQLVGGWDWDADLLMRCPSGDRAMQTWWTRRMRAAATPATIQAITDMNSLVDVRDLLPGVHTPTLVVHRVGDPLFSVEDATYLAEHIPGAQLRLLEGRDHLVTGDPAQILDVVQPFVEAAPMPSRHLGLAAVAAVAGTDAAAVQATLVGLAGRRRTSADGEAVLLFDGPATAVRAAKHALADRPQATVGISVAELELDAGPVLGEGVDLAVRLARAAGPGDIVVSSTAATLLSGSGLELRDAPGPGRLIR